LVLRLADKFADVGALDLASFIDALRPSRGQLSAVFASLCAPEVTYVIHGNRPMILRAHPRYHRVLVFARTQEQAFHAWLYVAGRRPIGSSKRLHNGIRDETPYFPRISEMLTKNQKTVLTTVRCE
jgi:hypothetical protein